MALTPHVEVQTEGNNKGIVVNGANAYLIETISEQDNLVGIQINSTATGFVMADRRGLRRYRCGDSNSTE